LRRGGGDSGERASRRRTSRGCFNVGDAWSTSMRQVLETLLSALRSFRNRKFFLATTVLLLSSALTVTNVMFTLVDAVLLRSLPYRNPERLVHLTSIRQDRDDGPFSLPDFRDIRDRTRSLEQIAAFTRWSATWSDSTPADRLTGVRTTSNLFQMLGVTAERGRLLEANDDSQADNRIVVITYALWKDRLADDPNPV